MEMDQSLDGEQSLSQEDAPLGEAPVRGVERAVTEHDTVSILVQQQYSAVVSLWSIRLWIYDGPG